MVMSSLDPHTTRNWTHMDLGEGYLVEVATSCLAGLLSYLFSWDCYPMTLMGLLPRVTFEVATSIIMMMMMINNIVNLLPSN